MKKAGVASETRQLDATFGGAATLFAQVARRFDISVVAQAQREQGATDELIIEGALFESGRPVIVVPYIQKSGLTLERVLACWDGGRTAARAIADAMPFLERAKAVDLVIVAEERKNDEITGVRMSEHLTRHGVAVSVKRIAKGDLAVQDVILLRRRQRRGLHGDGRVRHSRLRELHPRRRHPRHSQFDDGPRADVALSVHRPNHCRYVDFPKRNSHSAGALSAPTSPCYRSTPIRSAAATFGQHNRLRLRSQTEGSRVHAWPGRSRFGIGGGVFLVDARTKSSPATCRRHFSPNAQEGRRGPNLDRVSAAADRGRSRRSAAAGTGDESALARLLGIERDPRHVAGDHFSSPHQQKYSSSIPNMNARPCVDLLLRSDCEGVDPIVLTNECSSG